jgi:FkbM family methyltransferase
MSPIHRLYRIAQYSKLTRSPSALKILSKYPGLELSVLEARNRGSEIVLRGTEVETTSSGRQFLLRGSDCVWRLMREANASFRLAEDGVLLEVSGVKLLLQFWEELYIANDIFAGGIYNMRFGEQFVLIDVGMNVGTASLFFAAKEACQTVYGFELFPQTLKKARENFALNPEISAKIKAMDQGLAARAYTDEIQYLAEYKSTVGIWGLPEFLKVSNTGAQKVRVDFISCSDVFSEILTAHANQTIVCKLDCEGAEYEILDALAANALLSRISCFMVEWHRRGPAPVEDLFQRHGFTVLSLSPGAPTHSMIYAWSSQSQPC